MFARSAPSQHVDNSLASQMEIRELKAKVFALKEEKAKDTASHQKELEAVKRGHKEELGEAEREREEIKKELEEQKALMMRVLEQTCPV